MSHLTSKYPRQKDDFYVSPDGVIKPLLIAVPALRCDKIWEPAAGNGALVIQLWGSGCEVVASDLNRWSKRQGIETRIDFLREQHPWGVYCVTDPPNKLVEQFTRLVQTKIALLVRIGLMAAHERAGHFRFKETILTMGRQTMSPSKAVNKCRRGTVDFARFVFNSTPTLNPWITYHKQVPGLGGREKELGQTR